MSHDISAERRPGRSHLTHDTIEYRNRVSKEADLDIEALADMGPAGQYDGLYVVSDHEETRFGVLHMDGDRIPLGYQRHVPFADGR